MFQRISTNKLASTLILSIFVAAAFGLIYILRVRGASHVGRGPRAYVELVRTPTDDISPDAYPLTVSAPRVMCMIFTTHENWSSRGMAVRITWSRHCHRRRFFYTRLKPSGVTAEIEQALETVALDANETSGHPTAKVMDALEHSYRNYGNDTDWYLKADDDTYFIWHNLVDYLGGYNPSEATLLGSEIVGTHAQESHSSSSSYSPREYNSGGAGYLLSSGSVQKVMTKGITWFPRNCKMNQKSVLQDVDLGDCLRVLGIYLTDTRDLLKRQRFHSQFPLTFLRGILRENNNMLAKYFWAEHNGVKYGDSGNAEAEQMLSNESISFDYVSPSEMIFVDSVLTMLDGA